MKDSAIFLGLGLVAAGGVAYLANMSKSGSDNTLSGITSWIQQVQSSQSNLTKALIDSSALQNLNFTEAIKSIQAITVEQNANLLGTMAQMFNSQLQGLAEAIKNIPQPQMPNITMPTITLPDITIPETDSSGIVEQANTILEGAKSQAEALLTQAQSEAERIRQQAEEAVTNAKNIASDPIGAIFGGITNSITKGIEGILGTTAIYPALKSGAGAR